MTQTQPRPGEAAARRHPAASTASAARISLGRAFRADGGNYFLLLGTTLFLLVFGVVMVLSSSSVDSVLANQGPFGGAAKQLMFAAIGIPVMLIASRMPPAFWRRAALPVLALGAGLQLLVVATPLGSKDGGNQNWLPIAGFQLQPSEIIKVGLVLWLGSILWTKRNRINEPKQTLVPIFLIGGGSIGLVLIGNDLGTVIILGGILIGGLFFAGMKLRFIVLPVVLGSIVAMIFAATSESRLRRITSFFNAGHCTDVHNDCWQTLNGNYALADGGIFGVGLGNSSGKWQWVPAADNDFIFSIIGEELGLIGAIVVLALFVLLAISFIRIMRQAPDLFSRVVTGAVLVWVIGQACVNIGVVLGVFPVLGVPLPLVSAGGTALLSTLFAIGVVLSFARGGYRPLAAEPTSQR